MTAESCTICARPFRGNYCEYVSDYRGREAFLCRGCAQMLDGGSKEKKRVTINWMDKDGTTYERETVWL